MTVVTVGIDLAKNVFAVHGVNAAGKAILVKPLVRRAKLLELIATLPACLIGMEACSGAHYWAREFQKMGHTVRIMVPQLVSPYRMGGGGIAKMMLRMPLLFVRLSLALICVLCQLNRLMLPTVQNWVFRNLGGDFHARGLITRRLSSSNPARPYI